MADPYSLPTMTDAEREALLRSVRGGPAVELGGLAASSFDRPAPAKPPMVDLSEFAKTLTRPIDQAPGLDAPPNGLDSLLRKGAGYVREFQQNAPAILGAAPDKADTKQLGLAPAPASESSFLGAQQTATPKAAAAASPDDPYRWGKFDIPDRDAGSFVGWGQGPKPGMNVLGNPLVPFIDTRDMSPQQTAQVQLAQGEQQQQADRFAQADKTAQRGQDIEQRRFEMQYGPEATKRVATDRLVEGIVAAELAKGASPEAAVAKGEAIRAQQMQQGAATRAGKTPASGAGSPLDTAGQEIAFSNLFTAPGPGGQRVPLALDKVTPDVWDQALAALPNDPAALGRMVAQAQQGQFGNPAAFRDALAKHLIRRDLEMAPDIRGTAQAGKPYVPPNLPFLQVNPNLAWASRFMRAVNPANVGNPFEAYNEAQFEDGTKLGLTTGDLPGVIGRGNIDRGTMAPRVKLGAQYLQRMMGAPK